VHRVYSAAQKPEPELPKPELRVRVVAPAAEGVWALRIDNAGERTLRVPADIRLLRLEIEPSGDRKKTVTCELPRPLRPARFPDNRELYLAPGQSYTEAFDPLLFCFGERESEALRGGAVVHPFFGWEPPRWARRGSTTPFVVEGLEVPSEVASLHQVEAPTLVLSHGKAPALLRPEEEQESFVFDEKAPRLALSAERFTQASTPRSAMLRVTVTNVGHRVTRVLLLPQMLTFHVEGPSGVVECAPAPAPDVAPRDMFRTLTPGARAHMTVLVNEACGEDPLKRPGLYRITPTLNAQASWEGGDLEVYRGTVTAERPSLLRLLTGPEDFYREPPIPSSLPDLQALRDRNRNNQRQTARSFESCVPVVMRFSSKRAARSLSGSRRGSASL